MNATLTNFEAINCNHQENKKNDGENEVNSIVPQQLEKEEMDIWVWNNIVTRDKMRRKSISGYAPFCNFERRKRYAN